ncbi:NUDIX domain-containing protein [Microcella daejeonensis]|uniref:NUDIX domain-containing protein n=1 Tax=Microcella daejeonensis TaxID=2994971 RepID=A0A9E8MKV0_9MICO|nr:NUDIX domain-containing protein [Microcella daejeonensis]WAB81448.1 NUDIX domain-containing protein [Microcella daejeonensis]WAB81462.1 NUDIX domain-containing protein [Microcella daejeonensis]
MGDSGEVIRVSAALIVDEAGRLLVVRKRGTSVFMQPGGKPDAGENPAQTLSRELAEELGASVPVEALEPLGSFTAAAANEAGATVVAEVFRARLTGPIAAAAEIAELRWVHSSEFPSLALAPLITEHMLPLLPSP